MSRIAVFTVTFTSAALLLGSCANAPYVTGDSRGYFDTAKGMYGGNEFDARSAQGEITVAGKKPDAPAASGGAGASTAPAVAAAPPAIAQGMARDVPFAIDTNAFTAVFGAEAAAVRPSAEQLMRLDSLALVAGDAPRLDLQRKILACRRAGESCRLTRQ